MALILNLETATKNCSVALTENGNVIAIKELNDGKYSHAEKLHVFVDEVLKSSKRSIEDIDAIAVSKGPGSYTGLRIGVSAAKGLSFALNKPLISTSTLEALAHQVKQNDGVIIPMIDARRMEVYSAVFNSNHKQIRDIQAQVLNDNAFAEYLQNDKVYFIGDGVEKTKTLIKHENAIFVEGKLPSANEMASLSYSKYKISDTEDVAYFEPFYLKDFIAIKAK